MNREERRQVVVEKQKIDVKVLDEDMPGKFSDVVSISHRIDYFLLDFMQIPGEQGIVVARVIVTPEHMERIVKTMQENLDTYKAKLKEII